MKKKENIIMGLGVLLLIVSIVGVSYAAFSYTGAGSKINTITTGVISMSYTESDNVISMDKALPTTDATGATRLRDGEYFDFTVSSTIEGNAIINYEIAAEALSSNTFDGSNVKLYLSRINEMYEDEEDVMLPKVYIPKTTANTKTGRPEGMMSLTTGAMGASDTIKYRLRMYVKESYNPQDDNGNEVFQVKINVYGKVSEEPMGTLIKVFDFAEPEALDETSNIGDFHNLARLISSIITKDNIEIPSTAVESWDISEAGDGKAVAYIEENGSLELKDGTSVPACKLTLGGEDGLLANPNMTGYFARFENVESIDLTYLNTSIVTNMQYMFLACPNLTTLDINNFDTSNVTTMADMFSGCHSLTTLNLSSFDTSNVTTMADMFSGCHSLTTLNLSSFDTSNVKNMSYMFDGCSNLISLTISNFDTSNVWDMRWMFSDCSSLVSLDLSNFDTSNVWNMDGMFYNCSSLTTLDISNFDISNVERTGYMFYGCQDSIIPSWYSG